MLRPIGSRSATGTTALPGIALTAARQRAEVACCFPGIEFFQGPDRGNGRIRLAIAVAPPIDFRVVLSFGTDTQIQERRGPAGEGHHLHKQRAAGEQRSREYTGLFPFAHNAPRRPLRSRCRLPLPSRCDRCRSTRRSETSCAWASIGLPQSPQWCPPKRSASSGAEKRDSRCWLSGVTAATAKRRGDSARGNLHRSRSYIRGRTNGPETRWHR